jgi:hypothetical protein
VKEHRQETIEGEPAMGTTLVLVITPTKVSLGSMEDPRTPIVELPRAPDGGFDAGALAAAVAKIPPRKGDERAIVMAADDVPFQRIVEATDALRPRFHELMIAMGVN